MTVISCWVDPQFQAWWARQTALVVTAALLRHGRQGKLQRGVTSLSLTVSSSLSIQYFISMLPVPSFSLIVRFVDCSCMLTILPTTVTCI